MKNRCKKCKKCGGYNTFPLLETKDIDMSVPGPKHVGWCKDCHNVYVVRLEIEDVIDPLGRI